MFVRVVRFGDVSAARMEEMKARIEASGPPPGVKAAGLTVLTDVEQGTAVVLQSFETAEDMAAADAVFDAMDSGETPGRRLSVDRCATAVEVTL